MPTIRRLILAVLLFGIAGAILELTLLEHYDGAWQAAPLWLLAAGFVLGVSQGIRPSRGGLRMFRLVMATFLVAGALGIVLHYRGNLEFQLETDPQQGGLALFWNIMRAKAPPALAPGLMAQLGFLGLIYAYRHPATTSTRDQTSA